MAATVGYGEEHDNGSQERNLEKVLQNCQDNKIIIVSLPFFLFFVLFSLSVIKAMVPAAARYTFCLLYTSDAADE